MKKNKLIAIFGTCFFLAVSGGQGLQAQAAEAVMITEVPAAEVAGIGAVVVAEAAAAHSISGGPVQVQGSVAATEAAVISESPTAAGSFSIQLSSPAARQEDRWQALHSSLSAILMYMAEPASPTAQTAPGS